MSLHNNINPKTATVFPSSSSYLCSLQAPYFAAWVPNHVLLLSQFLYLLSCSPYFFSTHVFLELRLLHFLLDWVLFRRKEWRQYLIHSSLALNFLYSSIYSDIYGLDICIYIWYIWPWTLECSNYKHVLPHLAGLSINAFPPEYRIPLIYFFISLWSYLLCCILCLLFMHLCNSYLLTVSSLLGGICQRHSYK